MSRREREGFWQSFADLAMGLMAMLVLVLGILLMQQHGEAEALEQEKAKIELAKKAIDKQREELSQERMRFAAELVDRVRETYAVVARQDRAADWVRRLFSESGCKFEVVGDELVMAADLDTDTGKVKGTFKPGEPWLPLETSDSLNTCACTFLRLAAEFDTGELAQATVKRWCQDSAPERPDAAVAAQLRDGVEAVVVSGSTDREPVCFGSNESKCGSLGTKHPVRGGPDLSSFPHVASFMDNARLGADRAHQAVGHLLGRAALKLASDPASGNDPVAAPGGAVSLLMSRLRLESTSYGRYQAGPDPIPGCSKDKNGCDAARRIALRLQWGKEPLREPFTQLRSSVCEWLADEKGTLYLGLLGGGRDPQSERAVLGCPELCDGQTP